MKTIIAGLAVILSFAGIAQAQKTPTVSEQMACRHQADIAVQDARKQWAGHDVLVLNVTSRIGPSTGICYARIDLFISVKNANGNDGVINTTTVQDAVGGTVYASYLWDNSKGKMWSEVPDPQACSVQPEGKPEITCKDFDEFNALVKKHFGLSK